MSDFKYVLFKEHLPAWLGKGVVKGIRSSIVEHLVDTGHQIEIDNAFSVCYKVTSRVPKGVRFRLLCIAQSIVIRIIKPELCIQKYLSKPPDVTLARSLNTAYLKSDILSYFIDWILLYFPPFHSIPITPVFFSTFDLHLCPHHLKLNVLIT